MTTLLGNTAVPNSIIAAPTAPKKHTLLPLLTVLFLISYGLMTMLIVEQGQTIESQRVLIRELFRDSTELSAVKGKAVHDKNGKNEADAKRHAPGQAPASRSQAGTGQDSAVQSQSSQTPLTQVAPSAQAPSTQVAPKRRSQNGAGKKPQFQLPSRPASDLADDRRALKTI